MRQSFSAELPDRAWATDQFVATAGAGLNYKIETQRRRELERESAL
jgi:hypothetical protein